MNITKNFTREELNPHNFKLSLKQTINLEHLAYYTLQPLRDYINTPINITSGFRSVKYNDSIGGVKNSQHTQGLPYRDWETDRKSTRLNSSHSAKSRMPSSA